MRERRLFRRDAKKEAILRFILSTVADTFFVAVKCKALDIRFPELEIISSRLFSRLLPR